MKIKRVFTMLLIMLLLVCAGCSVSNDSDESSEKLMLKVWREMKIVVRS